MANINPGLDGSGNGNNWAPVNINFYTSSSTTYDVMTDVPTNTSATTANYCTLNPLTSYTGLSVINGNLNLTAGSASGFNSVISTMVLPSTGKYYFEFTGVDVVAGAGTGYQAVGIADVSDAVSATYIGATANSYAYFNLGYKGNNGTVSAGYGATWTTGDIIGCAVDMDAGTIVFYKNNTSQGTAYSGLSSSKSYTPAISIYGYGGSTSNMALNCGQRPFAYTPPTGFVALNTYNLPTPTIGATASSQANKYMDVSLYTGNGSTNVITNSGSMQPDMVWLKIRSVSDSHVISDSVRGINSTGSPVLFPNGTGAEATFTGYGISSLNSNGFTLIGNGSLSNSTSQSYVGWQWRANGGTNVTNTAGSITSTVSANTTSGFSIVTYTGTGSTFTVGHGLGVAPSMVIHKIRDNGAYNWLVYHKSLGLDSYMSLNTTGSSASLSGIWTSSSTTFGSNYAGSNPTLANNHVMYCFAEVAGFSKFGSYTGNGSTDGPFVYTGFRPKYVVVKNATNVSSGGNWCIKDSVRGTYNPNEPNLIVNNADQEYQERAIDFLSNGFKIRDSNGNVNLSGATIIYMAFAESPFKYANAR